MHHSFAFAKPLALLAAIAAVAVAGCGGSNDTSSGAGSTSASAPTASNTLSAEDQKSLGDARKAIDVCSRDGDTGALAGAVTVLASLHQIDPSAKSSSGETVEQAVTQARAKLASCGKSALAKQLSGLLKR